jgi:outer membrane receptor protein involved in Fe transport
VDAGYLEVDGEAPGSFAFPSPRDSYRTEEAWVEGRKVWEKGDRFKFTLSGHYRDADNTFEFGSLDLPLCVDPDTGETMLYCDIDEDFPFTQVLQIVDADGVPISNPGDLDLARTDLRALAEAGSPQLYITEDVYAALVAGTIGERTERQQSRERRGFGEFQFDWRITRSNYLLAGFNAQVDVLRNSGVGEHTFRNYSAFIEDEQRLFRERLILLGSLRVDDHSYFGQTESPRFSAVWVPRGKASAHAGGRNGRPLYTVRATYGKAFRSPNFVELFGETRVGLAESPFETSLPLPGILAGQQELLQESIETYEVQGRLMPHRSLDIAATLYHYEIEDEVILDVDRPRILVYQTSGLLPHLWPDAGDLMYDPALDGIPVGLMFRNVADGTVGKGGELEVRWRPNRGKRITLWGNYSRREVDRPVEYMELELVKDENGRVEQVREVLRREEYRIDGANLGALVRVKEKFYGHFRLRFVGRPGDSIFSRGSSVVHDVTLGYRGKRVHASVTGVNLTGTDYLLARDGERPDMRPDWAVIVGGHWGF